MGNFLLALLLIFAMIGIYVVYSYMVEKKKCLADCFESSDMDINV